jgi:trehalose 6-phosphate synthase/phosphatase
MSKKVIIVSNRLPVTIQQQESGLAFKPSAGGLATGLSSVYQKDHNLWIGWPGLADVGTEERGKITSALNNDHMAPVFLSKEDIRDFYEGFSNKTLWPLFHYFTEFAHYNQSLWDAYTKVNEKFCEAVLAHAQEDDVIWVHDYQLMLLPQMIREKLPNATIGFFQHIPFPSYEIFRLLPWRDEILKGVLGADLIGFHTYDDMRHFLSSVSRLLGFGNTMGVVKMQNRLIAVDAFPMGIDFDKFAKATHAPETLEKLKNYFQIFNQQKAMLSIDRLDYSKGIKKRLLAFESFLEEHQEYTGKVTLILIVVPSRVKVEQYATLKAEIDTLVGRINGRFSQMNWIPVHYFYRSFSFHSLTALYSSADVALVTPLRDGMNLVCKEFIASKSDQKGVLILSEMAGAAKELSEAILINPNDQQQFVAAIKQALEMPVEEQKQRNTEMQEKLKRYNVFRWVEMFLEQLGQIKEKQEALGMKLVVGQVAEKVGKAYAGAQKRILLLDYDGTLQPFVANPEKAKPDTELLHILEALTGDPANELVVISGRDRYTLDRWLGHLPIGFIAEHGIWSRRHDTDWEMIEDLEYSWKEKIMQILELYVDRTPGSFIERKDYSLVWHYRKADTDFGELRARELVSNLNYLIANMDLQVLEGHKVIEIKNRGVNKGRAAKKWIYQHDYGFMMAIGDDATDEDTFIALPDHAVTIKVGLNASAAQYNIKSPMEVRALLKSLAAVHAEAKTT